MEVYSKGQRSFLEANILQRSDCLFFHNTLNIGNRQN